MGIETGTRSELDFETELAELAMSQSAQSEGRYSIELSGMEYIELPYNAKKLMMELRENLISGEKDPIHCEGYSRRLEGGWPCLYNRTKKVVAYGKCADIKGLKTLHVFGSYICDAPNKDSSVYDFFFERFTEDINDLRFARRVLISSSPEKPSARPQRSAQLVVFMNSLCDRLDSYIEKSRPSGL